MLAVITEEFDSPGGTLGWDDFREIWSRVVRRIVLGDAARDDTELTDLLDSLRADANWAGIHPRQAATRRRFQQMLDKYVDNAAPGSLVDGLPADPADKLDPAGQVPHWLFAFDAVGIALWRLLAVLAAQPEHAARIVDESLHPERSPLLAYAGAAVQESVRLWPTTLAVLRESVAPTEWNAGTAPAGTEFVIVSSVFHRDDQAIDFANTFTPQIWLDGRSDGSWPLIPFSAGPAVCPGRNVVLLTASAAAGHLVTQYDLDLDPVTSAKLGDTLPTTFDHSRPRIGFWPRESARSRLVSMSEEGSR
jgi:hypothetical protein